MMLALIMLPLLHSLVSIKLRDEHFSVFGRRSAGGAASNQPEAGFGFWPRAGIADHPSSGTATVEMESMRRQFSRPRHSRRTLYFGASGLSAVAPDRASVEIICGSTMSRRAEFAAMMQIAGATAIQPKAIWRRLSTRVFHQLIAASARSTRRQSPF
jgi:hypothetical protein